ncbi:hypothetical protein J41TS12_40880 [Paenibacillus antibioticophila]|uniref:Uncharacterized protein n=1 Tax=Paenibacillus antibioticophila TaxID=1274374 RepID=A0A919XU68_9BACL|nr:hypothetical protein J41TS12_40880 [Paenibacillus antibioticophila]
MGPHMEISYRFVLYHTDDFRFNKVTASDIGSAGVKSLNDGPKLSWNFFRKLKKKLARKVIPTLNSPQFPARVQQCEYTNNKKADQ